jgi:hypothetical protein
MKTTAIACVLLVLSTGEQPKVVELSELLNHSPVYKGKTVNVKGVVFAGEEMTVMHLPQANDPPELMLVVLSEAVARSQDRKVRQFKSKLKARGKIDVILRGRFDFEAERTWGHQLCCRYKLTVEDVVEIIKK